MFKLLKRYIAMWRECFRNAEDEAEKICMFGVFILVNSIVLFVLFVLIIASFTCPLVGVFILTSIVIPCVGIDRIEKCHNVQSNWSEIVWSKDATKKGND